MAKKRAWSLLGRGNREELLEVAKQRQQKSRIPNGRIGVGFEVKIVFLLK
jgi:hypothetical protein